MANFVSPHTKKHLDLRRPKGYVDKLRYILSTNLDFQNHKSGYASHNFHSFPAKFPPQLPARFILELTAPEEVVLDPMVGSGTTIIEAFFAGRKGIGFDIDPLALMISKVKTTNLDIEELSEYLQTILKNAQFEIQAKGNNLEQILASQWDSKTKQFVDYWFARETQLELLALALQIAKINNQSIRSFFELAFSAAIITKSGGVSLALDLAHTRPHRAKIVTSKDGRILLGNDLIHQKSPRLKILTKKLRSAFEEFHKRCIQNFEGLNNLDLGKFQPAIKYGDAQNLPLKDRSVDLIVTSPPYASNAIDYMRAHKFSLIWFGYQIEELTVKRKDYIGGEVLTKFEYEDLPPLTSKIVADISCIDLNRGKVLHKYYSEMTRTLKEMYRVLKPGKSAIVVIGNSTMRGKDTETQTCLAEIGRSIGFDVPKIGVRKIDRNRRMLPAGSKLNKISQIQQRMHEEFVIGFHKS